MKRTCITCRKEKDLDEFEEYGTNINKSCEACMIEIRRKRGEIIYNAQLPRAALLSSRALEWLPSWGFKFDLEFEPNAPQVRTMLPFGWALRDMLGRTLIWDERGMLRLRVSAEELEAVAAVQITVDVEKYIKGIEGGRENWAIGVVRVCGEIVHKTNPIPVPIVLDCRGVECQTKRAERLQTFDFLQMICEKYKTLKYPDYGDPLAYWPKIATPSPTVQLDLFTQQTSK